jgi:hypothetical protein
MEKMFAFLEKGIFESINAKPLKENCLKKMCCVSVKLITSFGISLLKNCKKDFQFHIKTTGSKFFLHDLCEFHVFGLS